MEARDERPRHPVAVAITRHCAAQFWRRPEVLAMLTAIGRASAAGGFESEAARDRFCEDVGGGTARLCAAAVAVGTSGTSGPHDDIGALGTALEYAMLAGVPIARSGLMRRSRTPRRTRRNAWNTTIRAPAPDTARLQDARRSASAAAVLTPRHDRPPGNISTAPPAPGHGEPSGSRPATSPKTPSRDGSRWSRSASAATLAPWRNGAPKSAPAAIPAPCRKGSPRGTPVAAPTPPLSTDRRGTRRAHQALAGAVRKVPLRAGPAGLVYRTLAHIQLAALAGALRKPAPVAPLQASITPIRKLWIAWRTARRVG